MRQFSCLRGWKVSESAANLSVNCQRLLRSLCRRRCSIGRDVSALKTVCLSCHWLGKELGPGPQQPLKVSHKLEHRSENMSIGFYFRSDHLLWPAVFILQPQDKPDLERAFWYSQKSCLSGCSWLWDWLQSMGNQNLLVYSALCNPTDSWQLSSERCIFKQREYTSMQMDQLIQSGPGWPHSCSPLFVKT